MTDDWFKALYEQAADDFCGLADGDLKQLLHELRYLSEPSNREKTQQTNSTPSDFAVGDETR